MLFPLSVDVGIILTGFKMCAAGVIDDKSRP
jgi:hypothetical protein